MRTPRTNRERGSALVGSIIIATLSGMLLGSAMAINASYQRSAYAKTDSETALLLADSAINDELNYISRNSFAPYSTRSTQPVTKSGEPYPGRKGSIDGVGGNYWVFTSSDYNGTTAWTGQPTFYITANAKVNGSWRRVRVGAPNQFQGIFGLFGVFGVGSGTTSSTAPISCSGWGTQVEVNGHCGSNGKISRNYGSFKYDKCYNYNTTNDWDDDDDDQYNCSEKLVMPRCVEAIRQMIPSTATMTDTETWNYCKTNRQQSSKCKMWKPNLSSSTVLGPTTCVSAQFPSSGTSSVTLSNSSNSAGSIGSWSTLNKAPGSSTKRTLIFPPGDYYFESFDLADNANTELIIDNAGVTVSGGNPDNIPVRFFIYSTSDLVDTIALNIKHTGTDDDPSLRIFYGKDGGRLDISRPSSIDSGTDFDISYTIYAVTQDKNGNGNGCKIRPMSNSWWYGGSLNILGSIISDRLEFSGKCRIKRPSDKAKSPADPAIGTGFMGGYYEG